MEEMLKQERKLREKLERALKEREQNVILY